MPTMRKCRCRVCLLSAFKKEEGNLDSTPSWGDRVSHDVKSARHRPCSDETRRATSVAELTSISLPVTLGPELQAGLLNEWRSEILARLEKLERPPEPWQKHGVEPLSSTSSPTSHSEPESLPSRASDRRASLYPTTQGYSLEDSEHAFQGGTNLLQPISILNSIAGGDVEQAGLSSLLNELPARCSFSECDGYPECCMADLQMWDAKNRPRAVERLRATLQDFFHNLNPHCGYTAGTYTNRVLT